MTLRFKNNFTINGVEDYYILEGETLEELIEINKQEIKKRGLDVEKNNMWSEQF